MIASSMIARSHNRQSYPPAHGAGRDIVVACAAALLLLATMACTERAAVFAAEKALLWKVSDQALLRVDDHPIKGDWNIYQAGKKD